jgi:hypothetical protein
VVDVSWLFYWWYDTHYAGGRSAQSITSGANASGLNYGAELTKDASIDIAIPIPCSILGLGTPGAVPLSFMTSSKLMLIIDLAQANMVVSHQKATTVEAATPVTTATMSTGYEISQVEYVAKISYLNSYLNESLIQSFGTSPIVINSRQYKVEQSYRPTGLTSITKLSCMYRSLRCLYWWLQEENIATGSVITGKGIVGASSWRSAGGALSKVELFQDGQQLAVVNCGLLGGEASAVTTTGVNRDFWPSELYMRLAQATNTVSNFSSGESINKVQYGCSFSAPDDCVKVVSRFASAFDLTRSGGIDDYENLFTGLNTSSSNISLRLDYNEQLAPHILYTVAEFDCIHTLVNGVFVPTF